MDLDELIHKGKASRVFRAKRKRTMPNLVSHVTQRAAGKEPLFLEDKDYLCMLVGMKEITKKRSLENDESARRSFVKHDFVLRLLGRYNRERKKVYSKLLQRSVSLASGDVMEETGAVAQLRKALIQVFPCVFSAVANKRQIAQRTGLELLDEEEIMESIRSLRDRGRRIRPETMKARRFLRIGKSMRALIPMLLQGIVTA